MCKICCPQRSGEGSDISMRSLSANLVRSIYFCYFSSRQSWDESGYILTRDILRVVLFLKAYNQAMSEGAC